MKTAVMTDTNSGIMKAEADSMGIFLIPMPVIIDDETHYEGIGGGVLLLSQIVAVCRDKVRHVSLTPLSFKSSLASAMQKAAAPGRTPPLSRSAIQTHR